LKKNISFVLEESQYRDFVNVKASFERYARGYKYRKYLPKYGFINSKSKWNYALSCVLNDVRSRKAAYKFETIKQRRIDRNMYIQLYKVLKII